MNLASSRLIIDRQRSAASVRGSIFILPLRRLVRRVLVIGLIVDNFFRCFIVIVVNDYAGGGFNKNKDQEAADQEAGNNRYDGLLILFGHSILFGHNEILLNN